MLLPSQPHFFQCDIDSFCFKEALLGKMEMLARQILNKESDIVMRRMCKPQKGLGVCN